jgi:hypothetical protein
MKPEMTGVEYHDHVVATGGQDDAHPDWERRRAEEGRWCTGYCDSELFPHHNAYDVTSLEWSQRRVWVPRGESPPVPELDPEELLQAAMDQDSMRLPEPKFGWNPMDRDNGGTLVNLDTWFYLQGEVPTVGEITASVPGQSVTVELALSSVEYSAAGAGSVSCDGGGIPWSQGAESECVLYFARRSSGEPVRAEAAWSGSWSYNGVPQGDLEPLAIRWTGEVPVMEAQAVVTRVR